MADKSKQGAWPRSGGGSQPTGNGRPKPVISCSCGAMTTSPSTCTHRR